MRPNCVFPPSQWDPSPLLWIVSEMRLSPEMQTLPLHVSPPPSPPLPPPPAVAAAAAARASSNSRWTRLSMMETARLSSPPPLHFQLRKNSYSRKGAIGQPACPNIASLLRTSRGSQTPDSRRPLACYLSFTRCLMLPLSRRIFSSFFAAGPLPLLAARSLVGAHFACSLSDSSRSDL